MDTSELSSSSSSSSPSEVQTGLKHKLNDYLATRSKLPLYYLMETIQVFPEGWDPKRVLTRVKSLGTKLDMINKMPGVDISEKLEFVDVAMKQDKIAREKEVRLPDGRIPTAHEKNATSLYEEIKHFLPEDHIVITCDHIFDEGEEGEILFISHNFHRDPQTNCVEGQCNDGYQDFVNDVSPFACCKPPVSSMILTLIAEEYPCELKAKNVSFEQMLYDECFDGKDVFQQVNILK